MQPKLLNSFQEPQKLLETLNFLIKALKSQNQQKSVQVVEDWVISTKILRSIINSKSPQHRPIFSQHTIQAN